MKQNIKLKGQLRVYMQWPWIMTILLIAMNLWIYKLDKRAGFIMLLFVLIYAVIVGVLYFYNKSLILADMVEFAAQYGVVQNTLLKELSLPYAIVLEDGKFIWMNTQFRSIVGSAPKLKQEVYLSKYFPELNRGVLPKGESEVTRLPIEFVGREYIAELSRVSVEGFSDTEKLLQLPVEKEYFIAVYLKDVTELNQAIKANEEQRLVAGLIYIDNYDEVMESVEEVRQSLLTALIDRKINQYVGDLDGIVKKLEKDKYFIGIKRVAFDIMKQDKFSVLEEVKGINIGNDTPATLSIGLGLSRETYAQSYNYSRVAIDLALARGGDQAVIKEGQDICYYGGKREQMSKNTRVKARVKAEALREFIVASDKVIVMGHKIGDVDSFGAAIGIYRAATALEKTTHIILNDITSSVRPLYDAFINNNTYPDDLFITSDDIGHVLTESTMAIVVDTNKPKMTECEELLNKVSTIAVLDHHRQSSEVIQNAVLSYIESYASSSCEMVAEVLQYMVDDIKITGLEANSLYAGIMIDTNNFMNRTGVRTFEAAAFLRRCGADITYIRKLFRDDMESYRAKAGIIGGAEVYLKEYAIATCIDKKIDSPTIIGAQAANELLDIDQIKASFVLTEYNGKIYVSARAIDEVNVQIIMERLGGGGHINTAGAQFAHTDMVAAVKKLKETINTMIEEGDI